MSLLGVGAGQSLLIPHNNTVLQHLQPGFSHRWQTSRQRHCPPIPFPHHHPNWKAGLAFSRMWKRSGLLPHSFGHVLLWAQQLKLFLLGSCWESHIMSEHPGDKCFTNKLKDEEVNSYTANKEAPCRPPQPSPWSLSSFADFQNKFLYYAW